MSYYERRYNKGNNKIAGPKFGTLEYNFTRLNRSSASLAETKREVRQQWRKGNGKEFYDYFTGTYPEFDGEKWIEVNDQPPVWPDWI